MTDLTDYVDGTHLYLGVEAILEPEEKRVFLANFFALNPHLRGALVADVIDMLESCDAHLEVTEPLYTRHETEIEEYHQPRLFSLCCYVALYLSGPEDVADGEYLEHLWRHARGYMQRWKANRCGFEWRDGPSTRVCSLDNGHEYPVDHYDRRAYYPYAAAS